MSNERLRLLLVEDDEVDVLNIQRAMQQRDLRYPLYVVRDGYEALAALRNGQVPLERLLILLDLYMPRMNGLETLELIRQDPRLSFLPVVLLATSSDEQSKLDAYQLNIAGCLRKPVSAAELEQQLTALCNYWSIVEMP